VTFGFVEKRLAAPLFWSTEIEEHDAMVDEVTLLHSKMRVESSSDRHEQNAVRAAIDGTERCTSTFR
jgi:hypothetical protein